MRAIILGCAAFALTACDSGNVPTPSERLAGNIASADQTADAAVLLRGDGLTVGGNSFFFSASQVDVETALVDVLGEAGSSTELSECGAGPMVSTKFDDALTVNFQDGNLVGWVLGGPSDEVAAAGDVGIGTARAAAQASDGFSMIDGSTLGEEFAIGGRIGGFFNDDEVSMLYSGSQCFFR